MGSGFCGFEAFKNLQEKGVEALVIEGGNKKTPSSENEQSYYKMPLASKYCATLYNRDIKSDLDLSFRDRKFTLGGSSECWGGWIKPLEETTYKNRYLSSPQSSWGRVELSPFDESCLKSLNSPILNFDPYIIAQTLGYKLPPLPEGLYYSTYAWANSPLRLKEFWKNLAVSQPSELGRNGKYILTGFKLFSCELSSSSECISSLIFKGANDQILKVKADNFIIAMGGIENARFSKYLLNLRAPLNGNSSSNLGNFQEHPHLYNILTCKKGKQKIPPIIGNRVHVKANGREIKNDGYINISITAWDGEGSPKACFMINDHNNKIEGIKNAIRSFLGKPQTSGPFTVTARCEQRPIKESKINFLTNGKLNLDWKVDALDFKLYSDYLKRYTSFMISKNYIDDPKLAWEALSGIAVPTVATGGAHHMGTVAYSADGRGLVDENFKLLGFENIYIVGTSSFPSSGFENPTVAAMATSHKATQAILKSG